MKIMIPKNCRITEEAILSLKKEVKYLIERYEEKYSKDYKIYLYANSLKVKYKQKNYDVAIVEYNHELFWYVKPFYKSYLLLKNTNDLCLELILAILKEINSLP